MMSREVGRQIYREKRKQALEEKKAYEEKRGKTKIKSQGISLNDLVQLRSPIRDGYVRYIGEITGIEENCEFYGIALKGKYSNMGKHNGTFRGTKYFIAKDNSGVFCKRDEIEKILQPSALSEVENALNKLPESEVKGLSVFAKNIRRLTGLLSFGNVDGLNTTFEKARKKTKFTMTDCPFMSIGLLQNITSDESLGISPSVSYSYPSHQSTGRQMAIPEGIENEERGLSGPESENSKDANVLMKLSPHCSEELKDEERPTFEELQAARKSKFLRISIGNDSLGDVLMAHSMSDIYSQELQKELEEDFALFAVSQETRKGLNTKHDVQELIFNLQVCINVLKKHIPKVTEVLDVKDENNKVYMTNVIQDLLKRAQEEKLSNKILTDFSGIKKLDYFSAFTPDDVSALVDTMAWVRNNLCVAGLTDENDAKMTLMGAEEVQQSLVGILKRLDKKKPKTKRMSLKDISESGILSKNASEALSVQSDEQKIDFQNVATSTMV